jgi:hypothetical protein
VIAYTEGREPGARWGWLGPLDLDRPGPVTLVAGGPGRLLVTVVDADTGSPLEGARVSLRPPAMPPVSTWQPTDAQGRARFENLPSATFDLRIGADEYLDAFERLETSEATSDAQLERVFALQPASWISVAVDGLPDPLAHHALLVRVVAGHDPGWAYRDRESGVPILSTSVPRGERLRLKIRPGRYRVRYEVKESYTVSPTLEEIESEVVVPPRTEVPVDLRIGG